jgi:hypothetical protein
MFARPPTNKPISDDPLLDQKISVQSSALSLLAACLDTSFAACTSFLSILVDAALGVLQTERRHPQIRRAAVYLLASFVEGAKNQILEALEKVSGTPTFDMATLGKVRTGLTIVESGSGVLGEPETTEDDIVRGHARVALEELQRIVRGSVALGEANGKKGGLKAAMWKRREAEARALERILPDGKGDDPEDIGMSIRVEKRL